MMGHVVDLVEQGGGLVVLLAGALKQEVGCLSAEYQLIEGVAVERLSFLWMQLDSLPQSLVLVVFAEALLE